jgi:hypothetical protein
MGVEYYLVDRKNNEIALLGKGYSFIDTVIEERMSKAKILRSLTDDPADRKASWAVRLADVIYAFCCAAEWNLELRNDCIDHIDEMPAKGFKRGKYKIVYDRYGDMKVAPGSYLKYTSLIGIAPDNVYLAIGETNGKRIMVIGKNKAEATKALGKAEMKFIIRYAIEKIDEHD